jgi:molecular chaperone HscB
MSHPDHFALFALPARFAIDEGALEQAHKTVQSRVHPDRFASGTAAERRVAMQWAARANEAYRTLKSPRERAAYLCERAGVALQAESNTAMPASFLMDQMEWRELLEEARRSRDSDRLVELEGSMSAKRDELISAIAASIDERQDYDAAARLVRQLMFIDKFGDEVRLAADALAHLREAHGQ